MTYSIGNNFWASTILKRIPIEPKAFGIEGKNTENSMYARIDKNYKNTVITKYLL